jgi:hypothetical protein
VDAKTVITVVTIAISLLSLTLSGLLAFRQIRTAAFRASRTPPQVIHAKLGLHRYTVSTSRILPRPRRKPPAPSDGG